MCQALFWMLGTQKQGRPAPLEMDTETWDRCGHRVNPSGVTGFLYVREIPLFIPPFPRSRDKESSEANTEHKGHFPLRSVGQIYVEDELSSHKSPGEGLGKAIPTAHGGQLLTSQVEKTRHLVGMDIPA